MRKIAIVGSPNVGKSVLFNCLTGSYAVVSNYPGTTVEIAKGAGRMAGHKFSIIDTPGVNSLTRHSEDEKGTKDILSRGDIHTIIQVADSKNLKRSLHLTLELIELKIPLILNLNMSDEAKERGIKIDIKRLSERLGIDVIETVAITGEGVGKLKEVALKAKTPHSLIKAEGSTVRHPRDEFIFFNKRSRAVDNLIKETHNSLEQKLNRSPQPEEIAEALGISCNELDKMLADINMCTMLHIEDINRVSDGDSRINANEIIKDNKTSEPLSDMESIEEQKALERAITELRPKEKLVITLYYYEDMLLREIAVVMDLSESRVSQLHHRALMSIRAKVNKQNKLATCPTRPPGQAIRAG